MGYDYIIEYKIGVDNQAADSLSRVVECQFLSISTPHVDWWQKLQNEVAHDPFFKTLVDSTSPTAAFLYQDGVSFKKGKIFLSPTSSLLQDIIMECHSSPTGGHFGYHKMLSRLKQSFSWPQMRGTVNEFFRSCDVCQWYKTDFMRLAGLLQPLSIPERV